MKTMIRMLTISFYLNYFRVMKKDKKPLHLVLFLVNAILLLWLNIIELQAFRSTLKQKELEQSGDARRSQKGDA